MNNTDKYFADLMKLKDDEPHLLNNMLNFHKNPSVDVFNEVISKLAGDLYKETIPDYTDEFFITLEHETWTDKNYRLKRIKNPSKGEIIQRKYTNNQIVYTNPRILAWIYAAVKKFPWLVLETNATLLIERAYHYENNGVCNLINRIKLGPIPKLLDDNAGIFDTDKNNNRRWENLVKNYVEQILLKYAASGDSSYLDTAYEIGLTLDDKLGNIFFLKLANIKPHIDFSQKLK